MSYCIREVDQEGLSEVVETERLCFSAPWSEESYRTALLGDSFFLYGLYESERLAAYILFQDVLGSLEIVNIATAPDCRRRGYAGRLLSFMLETRDWTDIALEVRSKNIPAIRLYEKYGLRRVGVRRGYYSDDGDDALVMTRHNEKA
ncbi:MAG: ribosomal protein S18-alanine N-acetyltransferase [Mailhella sp.]|nr:ribosomal protein S18-alanine N-acetyltransferase [Mailhella sp.]